MSTPRSAAPIRPKWMFWLFGLACCLMAGIVGLFLYGLTLPDTWSVSEAIRIDAPPSHVAAAIAAPGEWRYWSMWSASNDATFVGQLSGPRRGPEATLSWRSQLLGSGRLVVTEVKKNRGEPPAITIEYDLYRSGQLFSDQGTFQLYRQGKQGEQTRLVWTNAGKLGSTTARLFRQRFVALVSRDYAQALRQLRELVEGAKKAGSEGHEIQSPHSPTSVPDPR